MIFVRRSLIVIGLIVCLGLADDAECDAGLAQDGRCSRRAAEGPDSTSLMQSANVRVDLLGSLGHSRHHEREHATVKTQPRVPQAHSPESQVSHRVQLLQSTMGRAVQIMKTKSALPVILLVLLFGCVCLALVTLLFRRTKKDSDTSGTERTSASSGMQPLAASRSSPLLPERPPVYSSPMQPSPQQQRLSTSAFEDTQLGRVSNAYMPVASPQAPQLEDPARSSFQLPPYSKEGPPPLCATLIMPVCEARFGVAMHELAKLGPEGEIGIVGLSGNPLLRAVIRSDERQQKTLEIRMPEKNSAPRATVSPVPSGGNTLEIRGMKKEFYGLLEMRHSGACYVIKNGQTVLVIDGDTQKLQLGVKSGTGAQLASVRCCTEAFNGVEHVEIRVEPGVDTVLVLAVVLGVLLLSA